MRVDAVRKDSVGKGCTHPLLYSNSLCGTKGVFESKLEQTNETQQQNYEAGGGPIRRPMAAQAIACVAGDNSLHSAFQVIDISLGICITRSPRRQLRLGAKQTKASAAFNN